MGQHEYDSVEQITRHLDFIAEARYIHEPAPIKLVHQLCREFQVDPPKIKIKKIRRGLYKWRGVMVLPDGGSLHTVLHEFAHHLSAKRLVRPLYVNDPHGTYFVQFLDEVIDKTIERDTLYRSVSRSSKDVISSVIVKS